MIPDPGWQVDPKQYYYTILLITMSQCGAKRHSKEWGN